MEEVFFPADIVLLFILHIKWMPDFPIIKFPTEAKASNVLYWSKINCEFQVNTVTPLLSGSLISEPSDTRTRF
jgi:hypothetical protein